MLITGFLTYFRFVTGGGGLMASVVSAARFPLFGLDSDVLDREVCCCSSPALSLLAPPPLAEVLGLDLAAALLTFFGIFHHDQNYVIS